VLIRLKKVPDGVVLACIRDERGGGAAVQRTGHGGFFALHDLMHYAVETMLNLDQAFYGLMASGWSFDNFTRKDDPNYRPIPPQAILAEHLVSTMSRHHRDHTTDPDLLALLTDDVNRDLASSMSADDTPAPTLTPPQVTAIYTRFNSLAHQWQELLVGDHMELVFPA